MPNTDKFKKKELVADWNALIRIFISPESEVSRAIMVKYMRPILFGLHDFLKKHVGFTQEVSLKKLATRFTNTRVKENPEEKLGDVITELMENIAPYAVNVASPYFVGHMTSAIPFFMVHLRAIVTAINQNVVKVETSKIVSVLEKQTLAKIHRIVYRMDESFYETHVQNTDTTLGCFVEDGTLANITALWVARNTMFAPKSGFKGVEKEGIAAAYRAYGIERCVVLVSRLGHLSIRKAAGVLGIGNHNVIPIDVDKNNKIDLNCLNKTIDSLKCDKVKTKIMAIIGIAGTTETGTVDPLVEIAKICSKHGIHFHADAAWGGPTMMSEKYRHLLNGIEQADSITIDGHKQLYMPMTCGMVYFKDPTIMDNVVYYANYVNRPSSVDLGIKSLAGSREAISIVLSSALKIMGMKGYALLIEHGIETAKKFADEINRRSNFELITRPELNILTYRLHPPDINPPKKVAEKTGYNSKLNKINTTVQILQREAGKSFVSRTKLKKTFGNSEEVVVLRCVIMNPMTDINILREILDEQEKIYRLEFT